MSVGAWLFLRLRHIILTLQYHCQHLPGWKCRQFKFLLHCLIKLANRTPWRGINNPPGHFTAFIRTVHTLGDRAFLLLSSFWLMTGCDRECAGPHQPLSGPRDSRVWGSNWLSTHTRVFDSLTNISRCRGSGALPSRGARSTGPAPWGSRAWV